MTGLFIVKFAEIIFLLADFFCFFFLFGGKVLNIIINLNLENKPFRQLHEERPEINLK